MEISTEHIQDSWQCKILAGEQGLEEEKRPQRVNSGVNLLQFEVSCIRYHKYAGSEHSFR